MRKEFTSSFKLATLSNHQVSKATEIRKLQAELAKAKNSLAKAAGSSKTGLDVICVDGSPGCEKVPSSEIEFESDGDDPDEDRQKQSVLDQILRLPLVYHLALTLDHVFPDAAYNMTDGMAVAPAAATNASHSLRLFDDDRIASVLPREASPLSPRDRGPEYYPGGEFVDRFRRPGSAERFFEGGFDDRDVPVLNATDVINITASRSYMTGEINFRGVADDR